MAFPSPFTHHRTTYSAISPTRPELSTQGKNAVVTGGGSGIGASLARALAQSGVANLALLGRTRATLEATKDAIEKEASATKVWTYPVDMTSAEGVTDALNAFAAATVLGSLSGSGPISKNPGKIDILVANAGYMPELQSIKAADPRDWWRGFETNVLGNFNLVRAFAPLAAPQGGAVVHISSSAWHIPYMPGYSAYRGSKAAATKVFEYFFDENPHLFGAHVHPGLIGGTGMESRIKDTVEEFGLEYDDAALAGDFLVWLISEEGKFLKRRHVSANWDVGEMVAKKAEIEKDEGRFTMGLLGWP